MACPTLEDTLRFDRELTDCVDGVRLKSDGRGLEFRLGGGGGGREEGIGRSVSTERGGRLAKGGGGFKGGVVVPST
jgi:hypothetical protein